MLLRERFELGVKDEEQIGFGGNGESLRGRERKKTQKGRNMSMGLIYCLGNRLPYW